MGLTFLEVMFFTAPLKFKIFHLLIWKELSRNSYFG